MSILNLIFLLLSIIGAEEQDSNSDIFVLEQCDMEISVESSKVNDAYQVTVLVENNSSNLEYFFFDKERHLLNVDSDKNEMEIKEKGEYFCIVVQNKKCHKKIDIKL